MEFKTLEEMFISKYEDLEDSLLEEREKNKDYEFKLMLLEQELSRIKSELKRLNIEIKFDLLDESYKV